MLRYLWLVCAATLVGAVAAYTLTTAGPRADFTYVNPSGIHTLDPARMSWTQDFRVALNLWEGLTSLHPRTLEPIAGAARFPPEVSDDGLTYRFALREDARWSNGDRVTAADFIRGWRRAMEPGTAADYAFLLTDVLAGAEGYVQWRRDAVMLLTALSRLRARWAINSEQARALIRHPLLQEIPSLPSRLRSLIADGQNGTEEAVLAEQLAGLEAPWRELHERALKAHAAQLHGRFERVGVSAPDSRTIVLRLPQPCPYLMDLLALPVFYPCHESIELLRERYKGLPVTQQGLVVYDPQWTKPHHSFQGYPGLITNGAYRLANWTFKRRARLEANPYFRVAQTVGCRTVDMITFDNINAALLAYEAGEVDFLPSMSVSYDHEIARLAQSGERPDFHLCPVSATYFLNFNCASETVDGRTNPFLDPRTRKAFALAIDKERIVHNVLGRGDRVAHSFVPPGAVPGYEPPAGLNRDLDEARRLLAEGGHPDGQGFEPVELLCTARDERVAQALARTWQDELNVPVRIRSQESKTFAEDKANQRYLISRGNWYADYNDPTTYLNCLTTGNGNNDSGFSNPRYDVLIEQANLERNPARRAAVLREAEAIIIEEQLPIVPIFHYAEPIAIQPWVEGLYPNARLWFPFRYVTVDR